MFQNHTAILFWSLGNESYAGDDIEAMNTYYKEKQDGRLIHYESSFYNRAYEDTISDVESRMYAKPYEIEEYLDHDPKWMEDGTHRRIIIICIQRRLSLPTVLTISAFSK